MQTVFAWILVGCVILSSYPWSAWLLAQSDRRDGLWLTLLLTLALSIGALTLLMFWESVIGIPFGLWTITLPYFAAMLPGFGLWWRKRPATPTAAPDPVANHKLPRWFAGVMLTVISGAILFNAAYWPFYRDDTLGIYHRYGKLMFETGTLVPFAGRDDAFYQAYPMQIPLAYTYAYLTSGWVNEYLAKTIASLFSLACLPAAYVLGRIVGGALVGWLSALLLAFAPTFARWASSGYVDLPMAFLYTLSAIFAWRLSKDGKWVDAVLTGTAMGLAAWTKNAALLGAAFLLLWLIYCWFKKWISLRYAILAVAACAVIAAPWYMRNWLEARLIVPPTAWTDQAERSLRTLLLLVTQPQNFALTGWVIVLAVGAAMLDIVRRRVQPPQVMLLVWTMPFFAVWWLLVSYDPRFVLLFLPLLCVLGGMLLAQRWEQLPQIWHKRILYPVIAIALAWTFYLVWISVEFKGEILRDPFISDVAKHDIVLNRE